MFLSTTDFKLICTLLKDDLELAKKDQFSFPMGRREQLEETLERVKKLDTDEWKLYRVEEVQQRP